MTKAEWAENLTRVQAEMQALGKWLHEQWEAQGKVGSLFHKGMCMFFAIDIDGVLARDTIGYATYLNRYFQLGIADSVIESLADYAQFIALKEVRSFVRGNEALATEFNRVAKEAQYEALVQQLRVPVDGALAGMRDIAERYPFRYVTCRSEATMHVTQEWLARYDFPEPKNVSYCEEGMYQKYLVAYRSAAANEPLIFIDDLAEALMKSFVALIKSHYHDAKAIRKRCGLLAFGHSEAPAWPFRTPIYAVWPLPNWGEFGSLIGAEERLHV